MSESRPRVLLFAPECFPPAGAEAIVAAKLVLAALADGWSIDVICQAKAGQYYPVEADGVWAPVRRAVHELDPARWKLPRRLSSAVWVMMAIKEGHRLLKRNRYDAIFSRIMPQYGHLPAMILARLHNIPWVANWSDPMPRQKAPPPYGQGAKAPVPILMRRYVKAVANRATWHTFPSERLRHHVGTYLPECMAKSSVVPHIALDGLCPPTSATEGLFTLCHAGGLGVRSPNVFLEGAAIFLARYADARRHFRVRFIGPPDAVLAKVVHRLLLADVVVLEGPATYEATLQAVASSSVAVVIEAPCREGIFFPSKVLDFIQTGQPVLTISPKSGVLSDLLRDHGGGIAVDCTSPESVARALEVLFNAWRAGRLRRDFGSDCLRDMFSPATTMAAYRTIFQEVENRTMLGATHAR